MFLTFESAALVYLATHVFVGEHTSLACVSSISPALSDWAGMSRHGTIEG